MSKYAMTGGATGIGAAIKAQLKDAGHEVFVVDLKNADCDADLSTAEGRAQAVAAIEAWAGDGLDGFIPCAGLGPAARPVSLITKVNYFAAVEMTRALRPLVAKRQGAIVLISSNSAPMPVGNDNYITQLLAGDESGACDTVDALGDAHTAYAGSKKALSYWMREQSITPDYAGAGIRMNAVAPGLTLTPLTDAAFKDEAVGQAMQDFAATVPLGKPGQPEQIASVVCFLLSEAANNMAGSVVFVDGGHDAMLRPREF